MKIIFWIELLTIFYVYFGYPAVLFLLSLIFGKPVKKNEFFPKVSIIISAYNEEKVIENKINSLLALDYPKEKMEILIGSDGSTDKTEELVSRLAKEGIKLFTQAERKGKPSMLNLLVSQSRGGILVFTDARQRADKYALKELVSNFSDAKVGSVSAGLIFEDGDNKTTSSIGIYWNYEKFMRNCESKIGSMLGATGAMYAIRKELFSELPQDLILDDVYIPLKAIEKGFRAIFEPKAKIYDTAVKNAREEFLRKTRTLAGNFQIFVYLKRLFNPFKSPIAWQLFSHKFLRLIVPFLLVIAFISNALILDNYFYKITFALQIFFYSLAFLGLIFKRVSRTLNIPYMFCVMNCAAVVGLYRFLNHKQDVLWEKGNHEKI